MRRACLVNGDGISPDDDGGGFVSDLGDCLLAWIQVHWGKLKEESMKSNLKFIALAMDKLLRKRQSKP